MSSDTSESDVREFYAEATLSDDRVDAILSHGHSLAEARFWKRTAAGVTLALAAMIVVCVTLVVRTQDESTIAAGPNTGQDVVGDPPAPVIETPVANEQPGRMLRLIAVRNHGDGCPHCRASGEVFAKLRESLSDEPVEFTMIDLRRNSESLEQSQREFDSLKLNDLVSGRDKALIAFADSAGNLHKLDPSVGIDQLERHIAGMLREQ